MATQIDALGHVRDELPEQNGNNIESGDGIQLRHEGPADRNDRGSKAQLIADDRDGPGDGPWMCHFS